MASVVLYQKVHTLAGRVFYLEEHLKLLFNSYYEVFNSGVKLDAQDIEQRILSLLKRERASLDVSVIVRLDLHFGGEITLAIEEYSLYSGYALRCLALRGALVEFAIPFIEHSTFAREAMFELSNLKAKLLGAQVALRSSDGMVDMACSAQLFAVRGDEIFTFEKSFSVEHALAKQCARSLTLKFSERSILESDISTLDELFLVDCYGVTPISKCGTRYYMSLIAEQVAELMHEKMFEYIKIQY